MSMPLLVSSLGFSNKPSEQLFKTHGSYAIGLFSYFMICDIVKDPCLKQKQGLKKIGIKIFHTFFSALNRSVLIKYCENRREARCLYFPMKSANKKISFYNSISGPLQILTQWQRPYRMNLPILIRDAFFSSRKFNWQIQLKSLHGASV